MYREQNSHNSSNKTATKKNRKTYEKNDRLLSLEYDKKHTYIHGIYSIYS